jgi:murein DD-endopeptidase MepM/ murein hydrolase activator NlpD
MREKISFLILNHQGSPARQLVTSKKTIRLFVMTFIGILITGFAVVGYFINDYRDLQKTSVGIPNLEKRIATQQEMLTDQHRQIQAFYGKINLLKKELVALKEYESRVREVSEIKDENTGTEKATGKEKNYFGVGGRLPEDIDTDLNLKEIKSQFINEMHEQADQLQLASVSQGNSLADLLKELAAKKRRDACTPSIRPVKGMTTSKYGYRRSSLSKKREFHKGFDIGAPTGTPIRAAANGVVMFSGREGSFGKVIVIDHGYGFCTRYAHASKLLKKKGDWVEKKDVIALVGNTGRSTGSHVHYEITKNGTLVNPQEYFSN